jgi:hypothetical protein
MGLAVVVVVGAVAVGLLRGGSFTRLSRLRVRRPGLVLVAVVAQLLGGLAALAGSGAGYDVALVVSAGAMLGFAAFNRRVAGMALVGLGLLANAVVVAANAAMPVSVSAATRAGADIGAVLAATDPRHAVARGGTRLAPLDDDIPVALPVHAEADSPGDVAISAGLAQFLIVGMGSGAARHARRRLRPAVRRTKPAARPSG